jgi:hypothetical protein
MAQQTRIYVISGDSTDRLVRAATSAQAIRHVVRNRFVSRLADQEEIVKLMGSGIRVEDAGDDNQPEMQSPQGDVAYN